MIDISNHSKAKVLAALYNNSKVQGLGFLQAVSGDMSEEEAHNILRATPGMQFDYLKGRVMKVNLSGNQFDPRLYDRDNGEGAAERAISKL